MSNVTALDVMRKALQQYAYTEKPAGSNKTKFGNAYGLNDYWCAIYSWWCGWSAAGKNQDKNPIYKNASAAAIQDLTVSKKGGKYILKRTSSNSKKKAAFKNYKFGDMISFNFNGGNSRQHTGLVVAVYDSYIWCIEGNTSFQDSGSQSNGGAVALRERYYTTGVCVVRPNYKSFKWYTPTSEYKGEIPKLPAKGYFEYKDKSAQVANLQKALTWANGYKVESDKYFGSYTFAEVVIFQVANGLKPDGEWGEQCRRAFKKLVDKHAKKDTVTTPPTTTTTKTNSEIKLEKIVKMAKECAWAYGTTKSKYKYPTGKRKQAYVKALDKAYPNRSGWRRQTRMGASCDVFVGTVVRASGVDSKFPRGCDDILGYMKKDSAKKKWWVSKEKDWHKWKPGTVIYQVYKSGAKHIFIYIGDGKVANAHYVKKTYPIIEKASNIVKDANKCKVFKVYLPRS